jgi:multiple sugar transport system substrate-binding protein
LRDVSKLAKDIASARGGLLPFAERMTNVGGQFYGVARLTFPNGFFVRKDLLDAKGVKLPKTYDPDVVEMAKKCQDPSKDIWGFGQTLNRSDDGNGYMNNILLDYGGGVWDKDGKPALGTAFLKQNLAALQFSVDTIQKHKIQPPGVMSWTDVHNNEAFIAGKLVSTNNGASLYYGLVSKKNPIAEKTLVIQTPGGPAGSFVLTGAYNMGIFKQTKHVELCEDLIRWIEDEKRFDEFRNASIGQAGPVYKARAESPYWKSDPNFEGMMQNVLRTVWIGYPGPMTAAAVEVQAQYILCDMAGRVVVGGLSPEAALKEAHARVEEIYKIRSRA